MILIDLDHAAEQIHLGPATEKAVQWLRWAQAQSLPTGRVEIDGERMYAMVQAYDSLPPGEALELEGHRKYIDLQYIVSGEEIIYWAPADRVAPSKPYNPDKDVSFGRLPIAEATPIRIAAGQMGVFFPVDLHAPKFAAGRPAPVSKIVVKVALE